MYLVDTNVVSEAKRGSREVHGRSDVAPQGERRWDGRPGTHDPEPSILLEVLSFVRAEVTASRIPLTKVAEVERATDRLAELNRHAGLVLTAGERDLGSADAVTDLRKRFDSFRAVVEGCPTGPAGHPPPAPDVHS